MLALKFSFERGRYHATEWRRNVNEGFVDWPPSTWRILRAIISSWKTYHPLISKDAMRPILKELVASPPSYRLPAATQSHVRHYMPIKETDDKKSKVRKALTIDSFMSIGIGGAVHVVWTNANLDPGQIETLRAVLSTIRYLGRAESLCTAAVEEETVVVNCQPQGGSGPSGSASDKGATGPGGIQGDARVEREVTDVLVPTPDAELKDLCVRIANLHEDGRAYPPHTELIPYILPTTGLAAVTTRNAADVAEDVTVVHYRIDGTARPLLTEAVEIGNMFKRAAMHWYRIVGKGTDSSASPNLSGIGANGDYLRDGHSHAFYLPTDDDGDRRLDHVTVFSRTPFDSRHLSALGRITSVRHGDGRKKITFLRRGRPSDFDLPIFGTATRWRSATPFVPNRHIKRRGKGEKMRVIDGPVEQVMREIEVRSIGKVKDVRMLPPRARLQTFLPVQFKTWRKIGLPGFGSYGLEIEFDGPVQGPLALGHGAHYGLGMFVPARGGKEA